MKPESGTVKRSVHAEERKRKIDVGRRFVMGDGGCLVSLSKKWWLEPSKELSSQEEFSPNVVTARNSELKQ